MASIYLYAILASAQRQSLGSVGLPDGRVPVAFLPIGDLTAVISEYRGSASAELPTAELVRLLAIHQRVVEAAMADGPLLPVKFGTCMASIDEVQRTVRHFQPRLLGAFERLGDCCQIEVAATWDLGRTFAEIGQEPEISALVALAAGRHPEETIGLRVQVGELVKEALDRRRAQHRQRVVSDLRPIVVDAQPNGLLSDELVLNVAFLVPRGLLEMFYASIHRLDEVFANRLTFRCIGPLPPYSFAMVEIIHSDPDTVDAARRLLGLGELVSEDEVTTSYRRLANIHHPDHNPGDSAACERFAALAKANTELISYLSNRRGSEGRLVQEQRDLSRPAIAAMPLLKIKRSDAEPIQSREPNDERYAVAV